MAVKYFCDGCDEQIREKPRPVKVHIDNDVSTLTSGEFHLCPSCQRCLVDHGDPRKWGRAAIGKPETQP